MNLNASRRAQVASVCLLLIAGTLLLYAPVREHEFVNYDDWEYVVENYNVNRGFTPSAVLWALTQSHSANWHPLTWISHMADCQVFGLDAGRHLMVNAALHAFSAALLFLFLWRTTERLWPSAFVAALFAIHPLRVESVAWVSERKDVLAALFFMLTLHAYASYVRQPDRRHYAWVAVAYGLGLMSKPMLVTLPLVLLLLDLWPLRRWSLASSPAGRFALPVWAEVLPLLREKAPLLGLAALSCVITVLVQRRAGAMVPIEAYGIAFRLGNATLSYGTYLWQALWPVGLSVLYPIRDPLPAAEVAISAFIVVAITALVLRAARQRPYLLVGWLWYLGMLVPVIGVVWVGEQSHADRFTYLPQIGPLIMVTWGAADLTRDWPARRVVLAAASAAVLVAAAVLSHRQIGYWRNSITLFEQALAVTENNYVMHANLGSDLSRRQRPQEAMAHFLEAVRIKPDFAKARMSIGALLLDQGRVDEALPQLEFALERRPDSPTAHFNVGLAMVAVGRRQAAVERFEEALRLDPGYPKAHVALAAQLDDLGRKQEAVEHLRLALGYKPEMLEAQVNLAILLEHLGARHEALVHYREAVRLVPRDPRVYLNLGAALEGVGDTAGALREYREALRLSPDSPDAQAAIARLDPNLAGAPEGGGRL